MAWGDAAILRDGALEGLGPRAEDERLRIGDGFDLGEDLRFERGVLEAEIEERDLHWAKDA